MKALVLVLLSSTAFAAGKDVTVFFEGDNGGEVAPCGCKGSPTGGLARRKPVFEAVPVEQRLVLDSGNALFANAGAASDAEKERARFVFQVMEELGTRVMAVGQRDLSAGSAFLIELAKGSKVKLLSSNLERAGKRLFDASTVIEVNGVKLGIVGVTQPGPVAPNESDVLAGSTIDAVKKALAALPKHDVTIVIAATSYADGMQLAQTLGPKVDFVIQSGEFRGTQPPQRIVADGPLLLASAQNGQAIARLQLHVGSGTRAFVDLNVIARTAEQLELVKKQQATFAERIKKSKTVDPALTETSRSLAARIKELEAEVARVTPPNARTAKMDWVLLNGSVADDAEIKKRVLVFEPSYTGAH